MSPKETVVSFEYFTLKESGHILNLAKTGIFNVYLQSDIFEDMYKNVTIVSLLFEEIEKHIQKF
jgi:hypothetical protein